MKNLFGLIILLIFLVACTGTPQLLPTQSSTKTSVSIVPNTPYPTETLRATLTVYVNTPKPRNTATVSPTQAPYIPPTDTPGPSPTPTVTLIPISDTDDFWLDLQEQGYTLFSGSSVTGPGEYVYSAYIFLDSTFWTRTPPMPYRESQDTEGCRIAFYRWDGEENVFLYSFSGAQYTDKSVYGGFPISCMAVDWENPFTWSFFVGPAQDDLDAINASGAWSDVNQNGKPEFAAIYRYCANGCLNYGAIAVHLYEIQTTSKVVDLTANLPGVIEPILGFVHSTDPLDFYIFDPTLEYCYKWCTIETFWIYAWDGEKFADISSKYADEYRKNASAIIDRIQQNKETPLPEMDFLEVLFEYEKGGLRGEAIQTFLEITNPDIWPDATPEELCWLQFARATALEAYETSQPFRLPAYQINNLFGNTTLALTRALPEVNIEKYDLSACLTFIPTSQP